MRQAGQQANISHSLLLSPKLTLAADPTAGQATQNLAADVPVLRLAVNHDHEEEKSQILWQ